MTEVNRIYICLCVCVCVCVCVYTHKEIYTYTHIYYVCAYAINTYHCSLAPGCQSTNKQVYAAAAAAAKSLQLCPTLCNPIYGSPPGSPVPGILHSRTLEWVAISFSNSWNGREKVKSLSHVRLLVTPLTTAYQTPQSMGFFRQDYWSGLPVHSPKQVYRYGKILYHQKLEKKWLNKMITFENIKFFTFSL